MSTAVKNALLRAASNELSNQPVVKRLLQELIDNIAGIGPGGGDVIWVNDFFVDPIGGNDATAVPGSLKFTYKTLQPAFDAAGAVIMAGATEATVLALPGRHITPISLVWPNVSGIHLLGLDDINTEITIGVVAPLFVSPLGGFTVDPFVGSITNVRLIDLLKACLDFTYAGAGSSRFTLENVGMSDAASLTGFELFEARDTYDLDASVGGYSCTDCLNVRTFAARHNLFSFNSSLLTTTNVALIQSRYADALIGLSTPSNTNVIIDVASEMQSLQMTLAGDTFVVSAQGNLGNVTMILPNYMTQNIDISGSQWKTLTINGTVNPGTQFPVRAQGCQASPPTGGSITVTVNGNVDLDIKGLAGFICAGNMPCTVGGTIDRDYVDFEVNSISEDLPGSGIYNWLLDFPAGTPASFPTSLGTDLGNWTAVVMPTDEATANGGVFLFSADCTVVPNVFQFQAQGAGALAFGTMGARVRMLRKCPLPALA